MKILVIDDSATHRAAASAQLLDHDLTVAESYDEGQNLICKKHDFEVVLADLLMPASKQKQGTEGYKYIGQEMPVGIFLALLAAKNGAEYVAVLTDSDHHSHPASACFDAFNEKGETKPTSFQVENAKVILSNSFEWVCRFSPGDLSTPVKYEWPEPSEKFNERTVRAKNWRSLLHYLLGA